MYTPLAELDNKHVAGEILMRHLSNTHLKTVQLLTSNGTYIDSIGNPLRDLKMNEDSTTYYCELLSEDKNTDDIIGVVIKPIPIKE